MNIHDGLSVDQAEWLLENVSSPVVRVDPRGMPSSKMGPGWGRARLLSVNPKRETAEIQPMGHKKVETIDLRYLRKWNSKNEMNGMLVEPKAPRDPSGPLKVGLGEVAMSKPIYTPQPHPDLNFDGKRIVVTKPTLVPPPPSMPVTQSRPRGTRSTPEQVQEILRLRNEMGKSYEEIRVITGFSVNTIMKYCHVSREEQKEPVPAIVPPAPSPVTPLPAPPPVEPVAPAAQAPIAQAPVPVAPPGKQDNNYTELVESIRGILRLPISDTKKLLAIDALLS